MIADLPPYVATVPVEEIVIYNKASNQPLMFVGFVAWGAPEDLAKLEVAAKASGFPASRLDQAEPESMVIYRPDSTRASAMKLFHDAVAGRYGTLRVELLVVRPEDAVDGVTSEELRKIDPDQVRE